MEKDLSTSRELLKYKSGHISRLEEKISDQKRSHNHLEKDVAASLDLLKQKSDHIRQLEERLSDEHRSNVHLVSQLNVQRRLLPKSRSRHSIKSSIEVLKLHLRRNPNSASCQKFMSHVLRKRQRVSGISEIVLTWRGAAKGKKKCRKGLSVFQNRIVRPKVHLFAGRNGTVTRLMYWIHT